MYQRAPVPLKADWELWPVAAAAQDWTSSLLSVAHRGKEQTPKLKVCFYWSSTSVSIARRVKSVWQSDCRTVDAKEGVVSTLPLQCPGYSSVTDGNVAEPVCQTFTVTDISQLKNASPKLYLQTLRPCFHSTQPQEADTRSDFQTWTWTPDPPQ